MPKRQPRLPMMEEPKHPDLSRAAEVYVEHRDARIAVQKKETDAQDELLALMHEHGTTFYEDDEIGLRCRIVHADEKVKVERIEDEPKGGDERSGTGDPADVRALTKEAAEKLADEQGGTVVQDGDSWRVEAPARKQGRKKKSAGK